jgi:GNAT superfamily N-acetyltransferase
MAEVVTKLHRERSIPPQAVRDLYSHAGWWPERTVAQIERVLDAAPAVGAWDGDRLVGFARIVTDGVCRAYVEDVVVHEQYRGRGIGRALMDRLLNEVDDGLVVSLFCKPWLVPFYERQGFQPANQVVLHRVRLRPRTEA